MGGGEGWALVDGCSTGREEGRGEKNACSLLEAHPRRQLRHLVSNSAPSLLLSGPRPEKQMQHESRTNPAADSNIQDRWLSGSAARNTCNLPQRPTLHRLTLPWHWRTNGAPSWRLWSVLGCFILGFVLLRRLDFFLDEREREKTLLANLSPDP